MATYSGQVRQGLPRSPGGAPWPAGGEVVAARAPSQQEEAAAAPMIVEPQTTPVVPEPSVTPSPLSAAAATTVTPVVRRGLPRVPGGEPWPTGSGSVAALLKPGEALASSEANASEPVRAAKPEARHAAEATDESSSAPSSPVVATTTATPNVAPSSELGEGVALRRGLPRVEGGDPWPAAGFAPKGLESPATPTTMETAGGAVPEPMSASTEAAAPLVATPVVAGAVETRTAAAVAVETVQAPPVAPSPTVQSPREPHMIGSRSLSQWIKLGVWGVLGVVGAAVIIVLAARGVTTLPGVPEFLKRYPGEYHLPAVTDPGFPAWARWTHFLNFFLMVLIIRSGWQVRTQQKPPAFWTPKNGGKKISINLWLHTSLDVLWLLNGAVFVVLLFVSGHWVRIVPTSWEVLPNAASAMLQYLTLEWPVENGWVNYNSLQQIMYFLVVFVAAPLAAISGVRMSEWWPAKADRLNKLYPAPLARAIHLPTMLFFVLFIIIHVFLVFSTGALRNLNHMFAGTDVVNWTGFWLFAGGLFVTVAVVFAARPLVLAPIASLAGKVSNR